MSFEQSDLSRVTVATIVAMIIVCLGFLISALRAPSQVAPSSCEQKQVTIDQMSLAIALQRQQIDELKLKLKEGS